MAQQIFPAHRTIYFSQLLKTNLSKTTISQAQPAFIDSRIKCEICSKLIAKASDIILVSLLLTFNIFVVFFAALNMSMADAILYCLNLN